MARILSRETDETVGLGAAAEEVVAGGGVPSPSIANIGDAKSTDRVRALKTEENLNLGTISNPWGTKISGVERVNSPNDFN